MAKKIERTHRALIDSLEKHAELASGKKSRRGRIERAAAEVKAAAIAYAAAVSARTGTVSPFTDILDPRLDKPTVTSLKAERDAIAGKRAEKETTADSLRVPLPAPTEQTPTLIELRERAQEKQVPGYEELDKAALLAAIEETE